MNPRRPAATIFDGLKTSSAVTGNAPPRMKLLCRRRDAAKQKKSGYGRIENCYLAY